jgi:hypothetical protein
LVETAPTGVRRDALAVSVAPPDKERLVFDLGLWLSGLVSFLNIRNHAFIEENRTKASSRDWTREFRLTRSTLLLCSRLTFQLSKVLRDESVSGSKVEEVDLIEDFKGLKEHNDISADEIYRLSMTLKDASLLNDGMMRAAPLKFGEWTAWCNTLTEKLDSVPIVAKLIASAEKTGEDYLPQVLAGLLDSKPLPFAVEADLRLVLPRFAKVLKWLSVIEDMLRSDMPLKSSLLIFSRIYEQIQELTGYINNRLLRYPDENDDLFSQLDGAVYTASIELRKVFNHELAGLAEMRSVPLIYAKIETAWALLNDSFQLTLINFAQMLDPKIGTETLFPNIKEKLEQSLRLRREMWTLLQLVRDSEQKAGEFPLKQLHSQMNAFLKNSLALLFYKDRETVERFIEEVLATNDKKDLVPLLHRFGAYLETLFGQVNMRVVLADQPFELDRK